MAQATLTVPGEYAHAWRAALVEEIGEWVEAAKRERAKLAEAVENRDEGKVASESEDLDLSMTNLRNAAAIMAQVAPGGDEPIRAHGEHDTLAYVCQIMASKIVAPRLADALKLSPLDRQAEREDVRPLLGALAWAVEQSARMCEVRS